MTKTYPVQQMSVNLNDDVYLSGTKWTYHPVAAAQDIVKDTPLIFDAAARLIPWTGAGAAIACFAMQDADNLALDTLIKTVDAVIVKATGSIEANLVASANPIVNQDPFDPTAEMNQTYDLVLDTVTGFYVIDFSTLGAGGTTVRTWSERSRFLFPDEEEDRAMATDINPRLNTKLLAAEVLDWT